MNHRSADKSDILQGASPEEADAVKENVARLKRLCRQRTVLLWKEWREAVEKDQKAPALLVRPKTLPRIKEKSRCQLRLARRRIICRRGARQCLGIDSALDRGAPE